MNISNILCLLPAFVLAILTVIQATYPNDPRVKSSLFKGSAIIIAVLAALLMLYTAIEGDQAQENIQKTQQELVKTQQELADAYKGVSQTVFQQDIGFEFFGTYSPPKQPVTEFFKETSVMVYVIQKDSPFFCKWHPTLTQSEDIDLGETFNNTNQPTGEELLLKTLGESGTQAFKFQLPTPDSGNTEIQYSESLGHPTEAISTRNVTLSEYLESQFLCLIDTPGTFHKVSLPQLLIKGRKVRFNMVNTADGWIGNTMFFPTWKRYCLDKWKASDNHQAEENINAASLEISIAFKETQLRKFKKESEKLKRKGRLKELKIKKGQVLKFEEELAKLKAQLMTNNTDEKSTIPNVNK